MFHNKKIFIPLITIVFLCTTVLWAQEAPKEKEVTEKLPVEISGKMYIKWEKVINNDNVGEGSNSFPIKRAYFTAKRKLTENWSMKLTTDIEAKEFVKSVSLEDADGDGVVDSVSESKDSRYKVYIKNALGQYADSFGPAKATFQFGMISTPIIGFTDGISGYRWIDNNFIDSSKEILGGHSVGTSADAGIGLKLKIMKMVEFHGTLTQGEGYKTGIEDDDGKCGTARVTINPIKWLYVSGYYRREYTDDHNRSRNYNYYAGGGAGVKMDLIKAGLNYIQAAERSTADGRTDYMLYDLWLNMNLDSIIGFPIIIAGRYANGVEEAKSLTLKEVLAGTTAAKDEETNVTAAGVGYKFNKYVQIMAYLERTKDKDNQALLTDDKVDKLIIHSEVKF